MFHFSTLTIVRSLLPGTNHQRRNQQNKTIYSVSYYFRSLGRQLRDVYESLGGNSRGNGEGNGTPLQYYCLENPMDRGAWWAAVHGVAKGQTRLRDLTLTFHFHALEKEMATHSSVLTWRIPGTGEPGGLPSMGLHRVGHDWSDLEAAEEEKLALLLRMWYFACWLNDHCSSTAGPFFVDALRSLCFCGQKIEWSHPLRRPLILPSRHPVCTVQRTLYWGTTRSGYRVLFHHRWLNS